MNPLFVTIIGLIVAFFVITPITYKALYKKAPADAGLTALVASPLIYGILYIVFNDLAVLNRMAITFVLIPIFMVILTVISALPVTRVMPTREGFDAIPDSKIVGL